MEENDWKILYISDILEMAMEGEFRLSLYELVGSTFYYGLIVVDINFMFNNNSYKAK